MKDNRTIVWLATVLVSLIAVVAVHAVAPLSVTATNSFTDANGTQVGSGSTIYQSTSLVLTNWVAKTVAGAPQDLSGLVVRVVYGVSGATVTNIAAATVGTNGLYSTSITVPALSSFYIQTDLNTNTVIYPKRLIAAEPVL